MSPADLERIRQLLSASLDAPADELFLGQAELDAFFAAHPSAPGFLDRSIPHLLGLAPPDPPDRTGTTLSQRYVLASRLTRTGFATVYLAHDLAVFRKPVIVKILDQLSADPVARRMFQAVLESLAVIDHPGVVGISNTGLTPEGIPFLVLDYVPGPTLRQLLADCPLPSARALPLLKALCHALAAAHRLGVAHLDIKPENIIISESGTTEERATILDFGIARLRSSSAEWIAAGSVRYMAPEQAADPTVRSDVYSLGLVACEMLTGRLPAPGDRPPLRVLARALEPDPAKRFPSAEEFGVALDQIPAASPTWPWAALAATLLLLPPVLYFSRSPEPVYSPPAPLVTRAGDDRDPFLSPDGQWLYFTAGPAEQGDIYRQSTSGGTPTPLVLGDTDDARPQPIPGNGALAFVRRTSHGHPAILRQTPGAPPQVILQAPFIADHSWGPQGNSVFFSYGSAAGKNHAIARYDLGASAWHNVLNPTIDAGYDFPAVSPDGKQFAYVRRSGRSAELFATKLNARLDFDSAPRQLTQLGQRILGVQWTPDSRDLIFISGPLESSVLLRIPASGGEPSRIAAFSQSIQGFSIARNAWKLAASVDLSDDNVWRYHLNRKGPDALEPIITDSGLDEEARPSPDGRSLVFSSNRTGRQQIWLADADGHNARQVTRLPDADGVYALWAPDSRYLLITVQSGRGNVVYRTPAAGPFDLTPILEDADLLHTSPDGQTLFFARYPNSIGEMWQAPYPQLSPATRLPLPGGRYIAESPDGKTFYYSHRQEAEGLFVHQKAQPPPPPERRLVDRLTRRTLFDTGRRGLYYVSPAPNGKSTLFRLPYGARSPQPLHTFDRSLGWGLRLAPDEQSLYLTLSDSENSDIYLIDSFR